MNPGTEASSHVAVIGLGAWGSALAHYCAGLGHRVTAWHKDPHAVAEMQSSKTLKVSGHSIALPANLTLTSSLADCSDADFTIVALPASAWSEVVPSLSTKILISATKGLEKTSGLTPLSYAHTRLGINPQKLCVISGPSFAADLVSGTPISVTAASSDSGTAHQVAQLLAGNALRVYTSSDPLGVELGGILKNIIAIAVAISDGLAYGPSTRAALISRGLAEMNRVATALGADSRTIFGLSGLGDLVMTATDDQSRNRKVGLRLGKGEKLSAIIASIHATAEGVYSAPLVEKLAASKGIETPIISGVVQVLNETMTPKELAAHLMSRPIRSEF
jgi:glycerol-3-phosphate dehydrogenase (NAD(P)+)